MDATTPVVVDTDAISFLFKNHSLAPAYQAILSGRSLVVSLISLAEIEYGTEFKNWGSARRKLMRRFLERFTPLLPDTETAARSHSRMPGLPRVLSNLTCHWSHPQRGRL
jgi:predicted nucleic acid-binding protein